MRKGVHSRDMVLGEAELDELWKVSRDDLDRLILGCAADLGMRRGEIAAMRSGWINFRRREITIPVEDGEWRPKSLAGARTIPVTDISGRAWKAVSAFFQFNSKVPIKEAQIRNRVLRMARDSGIDTFPHALRATAATRLADRVGDNPVALADVMGWSKISSADPYIRRSGERIRRALKRD